MAVYNVPGYNHFGGNHYETASLQRVLAYSGITAPHTSQPFSEEMLFGLGGGLGITYFVFEFGEVPSMYIGTRFHLELIRPAIKRLGLKFKVQETAGEKSAERQLKQFLAEGKPVICWADRASMPYFGLPKEAIKYYYHILNVYGFDEERAEVQVADLANHPLTIPAETLALSRAAITSQKNRILAFEPPYALDNLETAVVEAIQANTKYMLEPPINNFGVKALSKWADLLTNARDKKGWPKIFPPGLHLYQALYNIFFYIESYQTFGGDVFRSMYGRFLEEAAIITGKTALKEIASEYYTLNKQWRAFAEAALSDTIPLFKETKEIIRQRDQQFLEKGMINQSDSGQRQNRLASIKNEVSVEFPMSQTEVTQLLAELREHLLGLYQGEEKAATELRLVVGG